LESHERPVGVLGSSSRKGEWGGLGARPGFMDERVAKVARLLLELGAEVREDFLYVDVILPRGAAWAEATELRFCKRLFDPGLGVGPDGRLYYMLRPGRTAAEVSVLIGGDSGGWRSHYRVDRNSEPPVDFWDRLCVMAARLRELVFQKPDAGVDLAWRLWGEAEKEHRARPRRETYLLRRALGEFVRRECERARSARRARNAARRAAYEELMDVAASAPHSLNVLRGLGHPVRVRRIAAGCWRVSVQRDGEEYAGWGSCPVTAAAELLCLHGRELARRGRQAAA